MAIAGALVATPQAQHAIFKPATVATAQAHRPTANQQAATATLESVASHGSITSIAASTRNAAAKAAARNFYYQVHSGDTLSKIADRYYNNAADWPLLAQVNAATVQDPNLIFTGETLVVPAHYSPVNYVPRHAKPTASTPGASGGSGASTQGTGSPVSGSGGGGGTGSRSGAPMGGSGGSPAGSGTPVGGGGGGGGMGSGSGGTTGGGGGGRGRIPSGQLDCSGLEELWQAAGGNPADAFMAAEIAMAESGGDQYALSPTDDYGYWQINISNGSLATFDAYGNARAAIILSDDGTNWGAWTTYWSGAYIGKC